MFKNQKSRFKKYISVVVSVVVSSIFVFITVYGATTIGNNITTGGTLNTTGLATFAGGFVSQASSTVTSDFHVGGPLSASSSLSVGTTLFIAGRTSDPPAADGLFYYNTTDNTLMMSDGTNWFGVGSTTSGLTKVGSRLQMTTVDSDYFTFGTTTVAASSHTGTHAGASMLTLEATSTASVPLTLRAFGWENNASTHDGNLFQVQDANGADLFTLDKLGRLSAGFMTTASSTVGGALTLTGPLSASSSLAVAGKAEIDGLALLDNGFISSASSSQSGAFTINGPVSASSSLAVASQVEVGSAGTATTTLLHSTASSTVNTAFGVGTSTPTATLAADSDKATTTLYLHASGEGFGSCIQLWAGSSTAPWRLYIGEENGGNNSDGLVVEPGTCQDAGSN